ncbi:MAG TPA: 4-hydroxy-3-methylbut-2-enyl diphosphate reductase [Acidobacteriota bacterium]|nr:4-hydroxy-3-methylbut-2-enyl diphosphate reductase [Acidobacteriota bacterium]
MEVKIAKNSGLCYGVKRALKIAKKTRQLKSGKVYTLGDLIHNPQVISDLEKRGIETANNTEEIKEGTVIIRSHGASPSIYDSLNQKNIEIVDATCPIVKNIQKLVSQLAEKEDEIIIVGNRKHPETIALKGHSFGKGFIIENKKEAGKLLPKNKRAVISQSTQDFNTLKEVTGVLLGLTQELKIHNTICESTQIRQAATSELAANVDVLFIIGGKNSSNTNKLYQISKKILKNTYFIESAKQIKPDMIKGANKIGLSGGASTPPEVIQEVSKKIKSSFKDQYHREKTIQCQS